MRHRKIYTLKIGWYEYIGGGFGLFKDNFEKQPWIKKWFGLFPGV